MPRGWSETSGWVRRYARVGQGGSAVNSSAGLPLATLRSGFQVARPHVGILRRAIVGWIGAACVLSCAKERPFARGASPLEPEGEQPSQIIGDASVEGVLPAPYCGVVGCPQPLACDPASRRCVECIDSTDCRAAGACDTTAKACVSCLMDADCPITSPVCKLDGQKSAGNRCVDCTNDSQCTGAAPACDAITNECTARCTASTQCPAAAPVCNEAAQICVGCLSNGDCSGPLSLCHPETSRCVECLDDSGCAEGEVCSSETRACVECSDNSQCVEATNARCQVEQSAGDARFTCGGCIDDRDCFAKPGLGPLCRPNDGRCVDCLSDSDCADDPAASNCSEDGACIACVSDVDCSFLQGTLACLSAVGCVECTETSDCSSNPAGAVCKASNVGPAPEERPTNTCVECVSNTDCVTPAASRCEDNRCVPCSSDSDCAQVDSLSGPSPTTPLGVCDLGTCVQCTGRHAAACGTNVCNRETRTCSNVLADSADLCEPCLSDAHCSLDGTSFCSQDIFGTVALGFFCFPAAEFSEDEPCSQTPFSEQALTTTSDGEQAALCLLDRTTCSGMADAIRQACTENADCGSPELDDGRCVIGLCSLPCTTERDCFDPTVGSCLGGACQL